MTVPAGNGWILSTKQAFDRGINCFYKKQDDHTMQIITEEEDTSHRLRIFAAGVKGPVYEDKKEHEMGNWNLENEMRKLERLVQGRLAWK